MSLLHGTISPTINLRNCIRRENCEYRISPCRLPASPAHFYLYRSIVAISGRLSAKAAARILREAYASPPSRPRGLATIASRSSRAKSVRAIQRVIRGGNGGDSSLSHDSSHLLLQSHRSSASPLQRGAETKTEIANRSQIDRGRRGGRTMLHSRRARGDRRVEGGVKVAFFFPGHARRRGRPIPASPIVVVVVVAARIQIDAGR